MKRIKNYAMALVALVIAATSMTLMSFGDMNSSANQTFGMHVENRGTPEETRTWIPLDGLTEDIDYKCNGLTETCKGEFRPDQIDPSNNLPYENETPVSTTNGDFELL